MDARRICIELEKLQAGGVGLDRLLSRAVRLLHDSDPCFEWTGIHEVQPDGVTRLGPFVNDRADSNSRTEESASDERTGVDSVMPPSAGGAPLRSASPRCDLVVPIRQDGRVYAEIDINGLHGCDLSERSVRRVERVADWLASAYELRDRLCPTVSASPDARRVACGWGVDQ